MFPYLEVSNFTWLDTVHCVKENGKQRRKSINIINLYNVFGCYSLDDTNMVKKNVLKEMKIILHGIPRLERFALQ